MTNDLFTVQLHYIVASLVIKLRRSVLCFCSFRLIFEAGNAFLCILESNEACVAVSTTIDSVGKRRRNEREEKNKTKVGIKIFQLPCVVCNAEKRRGQFCKKPQTTSSLTLWGCRDCLLQLLLEISFKCHRTNWLQVSPLEDAFALVNNVVIEYIHWKTHRGSLGTKKASRLWSFLFIWEKKKQKPLWLYEAASLVIMSRNGHL